LCTYVYILLVLLPFYKCFAFAHPHVHSICLLFQSNSVLAGILVWNMYTRVPWLVRICVNSIGYLRGFLAGTLDRNVYTHVP
jgi:hypothetical protein